MNATMAPNSDRQVLAKMAVASLRTPVNDAFNQNLPRETLAHQQLNEKEPRAPVSVSNENKLRPLQCAAQQYEWGKVGSNSIVARLKKAQAEQQNDDDFVLNESAPYAELWIGTHPNGVSTVIVNDDQNAPLTKQTLCDYVKSNPKLHCGTQEGTDLTFLLKVLSIEKVLSIQAHPDKTLAERLHEASPHIYKDPNHKPEMAIALSDTIQAMVGFRPIAEIALHIVQYPELGAILGPDVVNEMLHTANDSPTTTSTREVLQRMFTAHLECPDEIVQTQLKFLLDRLESTENRNDLQSLILRIAQQFPGDSGILAPLLLNVVTCVKGEAIYIGANEPHAYICGDLLECMACSDNVVRAGLTPKLKDVPVLVNMLTYKSQEPDFYAGINVDECTRRYQPPVSDFCVDVITVPAGETYKLQDLNSPSVLLTLSGSATLEQQGNNVCCSEVSFGSAAFMSANTSVTIVADPKEEDGGGGGGGGVQLTRAYTNIFHDELMTKK